jgi:hypothetical protein
MGHLRARDILFDEMVDHPRVEKFSKCVLLTCFVIGPATFYVVLTNPRLASSSFA